jgi:hypothetical protein
MALRQLLFHDNSGTTWLCDGIWRKQVVASGGISQANQINAIKQDPETQDLRTLGPPSSVYRIEIFKNADAVSLGLAANAVTLDGIPPSVADKVWNTPADDPEYPALDDQVAPDDDCAWAG